MKKRTQLRSDTAGHWGKNCLEEVMCCSFGGFGIPTSSEDHGGWHTVKAAPPMFLFFLTQTSLDWWFPALSWGLCLSFPSSSNDFSLVHVYSHRISRPDHPSPAVKDFNSYCISACESADGHSELTDVMEAGGLSCLVHLTPKFSLGPLSQVHGTLTELSPAQRMEETCPLDRLCW